MRHDIRKFMVLVENASLMELDLTPKSASPDEPEEVKIPISALSRDADGRAVHPGITMSTGVNKAGGSQVVAQLKSFNSQSFTKLAQKIQRIEALEEEIKNLKLQVKTAGREDLADLFGAGDVVSTRVVETISFVMTMSKDPEATQVVKYASVITELEKSLTPELITTLNAIKSKYTSFVQKEPSMRIRARESLEEGVWDKFKGVLARFKSFISSWADSYDAKLKALGMTVGIDVDADGRIRNRYDMVESTDAYDTDAESYIDELKAYHSNGDERSFNHTMTKFIMACPFDAQEFKKSQSYKMMCQSFTGDDSRSSAVRESSVTAIMSQIKNDIERSKTKSIASESVYGSKYITPTSKKTYGKRSVTEGNDTEVKELQGFVIGDTVKYTAAEESPPEVYTGKISKLYDTGVKYNGEAWVNWSGSSPKSGSGRVQLHWCRTIEQINRENDWSVKDKADRAQAAITKEDIDTPESIMMREYQEMVETMAFTVGSTVYCGSRSGTVVGTVPGKDDVLLVELPNGQYDAFPMNKTSIKKPSFMRKAVQAVMGEDEDNSMDDEEDSGLTE